MKHDAARGFTIIETLAAVALLVVGFLALSLLHVGAFRSTSLARGHTLATVLAYDQIERFQRLGSGNVAAGNDVPTADGQQFSRSWTTATNAGASKTVEVTVAWTDQWGAHTVKLPAVVRQ